MLKKFAVFFLVVGLFAGGLCSAAAAQAKESSIVKIGDNVEIARGQVVDDAVAIGGSVTVYGRVRGDAVAVGGSVHLKDYGRVGGDAVAVGGSVIKDPTAAVSGSINEVGLAGMGPMFGMVGNQGLCGWTIFSLLSFIGYLGLVAILVALFPNQLARVSSLVESKKMRTFLWGVLAAFLFVPVIILLAVSIAGIVLIPVWIVVFGTGALFGYIAAAQFIGRKVLKAFKLNLKTAMAETLVGVLILALVGLVPVVGFVIKAVVSCMGLGGVALTWFGTKKA